MDPVLVRLNRRRCILLGMAQAAIALMTLSLVALPIWFGIFDWLIAAGLITAAFFGWFALFFFGLARRNPVALRMDAKGLSGYYTDPATWDEVKAAFAFTGQKGHRFLGFELHDPVGFRARQSPWRRYLSWSNGRAHRAHLVVPQIVLAEATVDDLAQRAERLLISASE